MNKAMQLSKSMPKPHFIAAILSALILFSTAPAHAFEPLQRPDEAIKSLKQVDCLVDVKECRYFAAVEVAAFVDVCPGVFEERFNFKMRPDQIALTQNLLSSWTALDDPEIKSAVLNPDNKLRIFLGAESKKYLLKIPSTDLGVECQRLGAVKENEPAENMSDLLNYTRNYAAFAKIRDAAMQKHFQENQERLRREMSK